MDDAQIVLSLLNFYRSQGIDLHHLLDDPIFNTLSLPTKVQMIKTYAADLAAGITPRLKFSDLSHSKLDIARSAAAGGLAGFGAIKALGIKPHPVAVAGATVTGLTFGTGLALMRRLNEVSERRSLKNQLLQVAHNPSDESVLGVLAMRGLQNRTRPERTKSFNELLEQAKQVGTEASKRIATNAARNIETMNTQD